MFSFFRQGFMCERTSEFWWAEQNPELQGKDVFYDENNFSNEYDEDGLSHIVFLYQLSLLKCSFSVHKNQVDLSYLGSGNWCLMWQYIGGVCKSLFECLKT